MSLALLFPSPALAHGDLERLAPFYAGMLHPLLVPPQVVALLALGLVLGQCGMARGRDGLTALLAGLLLGLWVSERQPADLSLALLAVGLGLALCAVLARPLPPHWRWALGAGVGLAVGLGSAPEVAPATARWAWLAGSATGAFACCAVVAALADSAQARAPRWPAIGIRVVASWLAASSLLVLALTIMRWPAPG